MSKIVIVDYGMGNLRSVQKAFEVCGCDATLSSSAGEIEGADALVVPGVGSFGDCLENLRRRGLTEAVSLFLSSGKPYLGICLGLHILFTLSDEAEGSKGLNFFRGRVKRFRGEMKIPHMGWNTISQAGGRKIIFQAGAADDGCCPLFKGVENGSYVYFVHSYYPVPDDGRIVSAVTDYGGEFASAVWKGNIMATQFHPEKSQRVGLKIIGNFIDFVCEKQ